MKPVRSVYGLFAVGAVTILVLAACGEPGPPPGTPEALYLDLGCVKCHGPDRQGQKSGPPLLDIGDNWQEEDLLEYLADPKGVMEKTPRLKYMAENYPIMMPAYADTNEEDLRKLARFILES
jgi:mono/diheme cytochrome c family protein